MLSRADLHPYQTHAVERTLAAPRILNGMAMGLGKTVTTLTAIADLIDRMEAGRVLVVAPLRVAKDVWAPEAARWAHLKHLRVSVATGDAKSRLKALSAPADVYVINVDNLAWLVDRLSHKAVREEYGLVVPDTLVLDEASAYKHRGSLRFRAARMLAKAADRVIALSATPASNGYLDLWAPYYLLDFGERLGPSYPKYQSAYFEPADYLGYKWRLKPNAEIAIQKQVADITMVLRAEDYLTLPPVTVRDINTPLSGSDMAAYRRFERQLTVALPDGQIEAVNAAVLAGKLLQFAAGQIYDADHNPQVIHRVKLDALKEIIEEAAEPVLVGYGFTSDRDRILAEIPGAVHLDANPETIARWNRGEIPVLLCHPASAAHGLNLQYGGRHLVWYSMPWSLELYQQLIGRIARQGQTRPVLVHRLIAPGTIDETVAMVLGDKGGTQEGLLNALRTRVEPKLNAA